MSSYGWGQMGESMVAGFTFLLVMPFVVAIMLVGSVSLGFVLWSHSMHPVWWGLAALLPAYVLCFISYCVYLHKKPW